MNQHVKDLEVEVVPVELELKELRSLGELVPATDVVTVVAPRRPPNWLFIGTLVVPMLLAGLYLFLVAADRYRSEVRFTVRSTGGGAAAAPLEGGMGSSLGSAGLTRASADAFVVNEYILSRDALDKLVTEKNLRDIIGRPKLDVLARFPGLFSGTSNERLFDYYKSMVTSEVDETTGISTIQVTAFTPEDAQTLARALLGYAEGVVNRINDRANRDRVGFAAQVVDRAKGSLADAEKTLTAFRTDSGVVDPQSEYKAALQNVSRLSAEASQRDAALAQQVTLTPNGPAIASLREKVRSLRAEIAAQNQQIAGASGSLAVKLGRFEQLTLDREIASKELVNAQMNYESSLQAASEQQLYLQPIAEANAPDLPYGPKRLLIMGAVLLLGLMAYSILKSLRDLAADHAA